MLNRMPMRQTGGVPAQHYTLTASGSSYTVSGTAATVKAGRKVGAQAGSVTWTGTASTLKRGRTMVGGAGSVVLVGPSATTKASRRSVLTAGSVAIQGVDPHFARARTMSAAGDAFAVSAGYAALKYGHVVARWSSRRRGKDVQRVRIMWRNQ